MRARRRAAEERCGDRVDGAEPPADEHGDDDEHDRVEQDLPRRLAIAACPGQHRHVRRCVVLLEHQRQGPEMRRRPEEHDQEQPERRQRKRPGGGRVADERRYRSRGAADHDVPVGRPLEVAGVHDDVEEAADEGEHRRQHVDRGREEGEREPHQATPNSSARGAGTRPDATGRAAVRSPIACRCRRPSRG